MSYATSASSIIRYIGTAKFYDLYYQFLAYFPSSWHGGVSFILALVIVYAAYKVIKRNFVYIILLVLLLPQSVPILKTIWQSGYEIVRFLLKR